jgi:hypothetical protein
LQCYLKGFNNSAIINTKKVLENVKETFNSSKWLKRVQKAVPDCLNTIENMKREYPKFERAQNITYSPEMKKCHPIPTLYFLCLKIRSRALLLEQNAVESFSPKCTARDRQNYLAKSLLIFDEMKNHFKKNGK